MRLHDDALSHARPAVNDVLDQVAGKLADAGHTVKDIDSPVSFESLREQQWRSFLFEMSRIHSGLLEQPKANVGMRLREAIAEGLEIDRSEYHALRTSIAAARQQLFGALCNADATLWPAAPGTAPEGLAWTGDPRFVSPWTALGGPVVSVPAGFDDQQLPIGVLLTAAPGEDRKIAQTAVQLAMAFEV